ncbi:MAG TPA: FUSC family protein, partial [Novosphingobium sp.]|nr:FUSC family protein [Novosphingobium sp.]
MLRSFRPLVYGLNSFAGAALALLVGLLVGLPIPYWAMSTAFIVSHPLSGATRSKAVYRVFGTVIGATVAIIMVPAMAEAPVLLTLGLSAWLGVCLFFSMLDRSPRSYVVMLAGYTAAMIAFPSVDAPQMVWDTAVARVTEITLGIVCATFVHSVFWPQSVGNVLRAKARGWLRDASQWLLDCVDNAEIEQLGADRRHLAVDAVDLKILATHLPFDTSHLADTTRTVRALLGRMLLLLPLLSGLSDRRVALGGPLAPDMAALFARVRDWIDRGIPEGEASALAAATAELARTHDASDWRGQISTALLVRLEQAIGTVDICHRISRHLDDPAPAQDAEL